MGFDAEPWSGIRGVRRLANHENRGPAGGLGRPGILIRGRGLHPRVQRKGKGEAKAPRSHIVRSSDPDAFLKEVNEYFEKGFRPVQDMRVFAAFNRAKQRWETLYVMPLVHFEELKAFQTIPTSDEEEPERMFG